MRWKRRQPLCRDVTQDCEAFVKEHYFSNSGKEANKNYGQIFYRILWLINYRKNKQTWTLNIWSIQSSIIQKTISKTLSNTAYNTQTVWAWWQVALPSLRSWHRNILGPRLTSQPRPRRRLHWKWRKFGGKLCVISPSSSSSTNIENTFQPSHHRQTRSGSSKPCVTPGSIISILRRTFR